jgi:hypothetical protein
MNDEGLGGSEKESDEGRRGLQKGRKKRRGDEHKSESEKKPPAPKPKDIKAIHGKSKHDV